MKINISVSLDGAIKALCRLEKQTKVATMIALTKTAKHTQRLMYDEFRKELDRPTPTMMKSLFVDPAKLDKLQSRVYLKDKRLGGKNPRSMKEIVGHHFSGGSRANKVLEDLLRQNNYLSAGEFVVPGAAAKLDRYGNISRGQINQILSQLFVRRAGFDSTPTSSARSRSNVAKVGRIFWSYGQGGKKQPLVDKATGITYGYSGGRANHLAKGAWVANGRSVKPLLLVISEPKYRRLFDFQRTGQAAVDRYFPDEFDAALAKVKATER